MKFINVILLTFILLIFLNLANAFVFLPFPKMYRASTGMYEMEIRLYKNSWNPIGIPLKDPIIDESDCKGKYYKKVFYWKPTEWRYGYVDSLRKMEGGVGYWVFSKDDCTLKISGSVPITPEDVILHTGWNFISSMKVNGRSVVKQDLQEKCYVESGPYYYNPLKNEWEIVNELKEGGGYWIQCSSLVLDNCVLNRDTWEITCDTNCKHTEGSSTIIMVTDKNKNVAFAFVNDERKGEIRITDGKITFSTEPSLNELDNDVGQWRVVLICNEPAGQIMESGVR